MKTMTATRGLLMAAIVIFIFGIHASALKPANSSLKTLQTLLEESIQSPALENAELNSGSVDVLFKIDDDHQIIIKKMSYDNEEIASCVKEQLSKISFKGIENHYNQYYKIRITFKVE